MEPIGEDEAVEDARIPEEFSSFTPATDYAVAFEDIEIGPEIGHGAFSKVYRGSLHGQEVAIKVQAASSVGASDKYVNSELAILKGVEHRNLIKYLGACLHKKQAYIVTELLKGGDLSAVLARTEVELSWKRRLLVAKDALEAINYLHEKELIHRDIKTENILVDDNWRCVVCDYGFARQKTSKAMTICGTDEFMAPEVIFGEVYDEKADVFSYGLVLAEIMTRKPPGRRGFLERHPRDKFALNFDELREAVPADCPASLVELCVQCCEYEPEIRLDAMAALDWLDDIIGELPDDLPTARPPVPSDLVSRTASGTEVPAGAGAGTEAPTLDAGVPQAEVKFSLGGDGLPRTPHGSTAPRPTPKKSPLAT